MNIFRRNRMILLLLMAIPLSAQEIQLSIPDTNAVRGELITLPVRVQSSLTDQNVTSYELNILFDDYMLTVDSVLAAGTMTGLAGMSYYYHLPQTNVISIAAAGTNPLQGESTLIHLRFRIRHSGYSELHFTGPMQNILNEGTPAVFLDDGSLYASEPFSISIWPDQSVLAVGEQEQFYIYNATEPIQWKITNSTVASIDADGILTALKSGTVRVVATDAGNLKDTTNGFIEIRPVKLSIQDTTVTMGQMIEIPIYTSMLTNLGIISGTVALSFDGNILSPTALLTTGTVLGSYSNVTMNTTVSGKATIAFAGTSPLSGAGMLCKVQFTATQSGWTPIEFSQAIFNESLLAKTVTGSLWAQPATVLYMDPQESEIIVGDVLQFTATNGTPPYTWEVTNPLIASINNDGLLIATKSGLTQVIVRDAASASGISAGIRIYNVKISIGNVYATTGMILEIPICIEQFNDGAAVSAFQTIIDFDSTALKAVAVLNTGTLSEGWSYVQANSGNRLSIAAAGTAGIHAPGTLFSIRFQVNGTLTEGYYSVISFNRMLLNEGDPSVLLFNGSVLIVAAPSEPYLASPEDGAENLPPDIEFIWYESAQAETYHLQISGNPQFSEITFQDSLITRTTRQVTGFADGWYYWRVRAFNTAGTSAWSSVRSFSVCVQIVVPPAEPDLILPDDGAENLPQEVEFSWNASSGAETYWLQIADNSSFTPIAFQDSLITGTSLLVTGLADGLYYWRINASNTGGTSAWSSVRSFSVGPPLGVNEFPNVPSQFGLLQNYPNPFNPTTTIRYDIPKASQVTLTIYNMNGQVVERLVNQKQEPGFYSVNWDALNVSTGVYFYRIQADGFQQVKKCLLIK
ncbi:T9SS type A sorting domain-containing protein [bacterium]|nr:T9SS type A sorting domain-containing protein [bacterium]MBU1063669.1 T9SS type A sorting domain-containing protein [bacterium]MBU1633742.1 T9SS type A sorting domain-containing protein [bacterium]MBU1874362.1 T9SS type A sorting domain-containing protein [bacterium]